MVDHAYYTIHKYLFKSFVPVDNPQKRLKSLVHIMVLVPFAGVLVLDELAFPKLLKTHRD
jgi:hypothetical protein